MASVSGFSPTPTEQQRGPRQMTGRRYFRDFLLFHRARQLGCSNEYGWGAQLEQQPLLLAAPPGLELACDSQPPTMDLSMTHLGVVTLALILDDTPVLTLDAMLTPCGRVNSSSQLSSQEPDGKQPKSGLYICLSECIDDASTVASDGGESPALILQDHSDGASAHSSPLGCVSKDGPRTPVVCSLEKALGFALTTPTGLSVNARPSTPISLEASIAKPSTPISLEAMLGLCPASQPGARQEGIESGGAWTPSQASLGTLPLGVNSLVCPWWWPNVADVPNPSNDTDKPGSCTQKGVTGSPDAAAIWPGAWEHSMHTNSMSGNVKASSGAVQASEVFQI